MFKFKKNDIAYLIVKHKFKPTEYIKCKILMCITSREWYKKYEPWRIIETYKYYKYTIETDQSETSHFSTNSKNQYIEYDEKDLITINNYRAIKLKKLSTKKYLNFFPKKIFEIQLSKLFSEK